MYRKQRIGPMNNKQRSVFFLYEGLPPTIIESQVLAHVRSMGDVGIHVEVWTFAVTRNAYAEGLAALTRLQTSFPTVKISLFRGFRPALPFRSGTTFACCCSGFGGFRFCHHLFTHEPSTPQP
jgi:hypothetical protein